MNAAEPLPPWAMNPGARYEAFWMECCDPHVHSTWLPFRNALDEGGAPTISHGSASAGERIDAEDIASGVLQPNGMPWPQPKAPCPSLWRRLHGWLWTLGHRLSDRR